MKLGFVSDIHEDVISLKKGFDALHREHCDQIICLGDIIGFSNPYYPYTKTKDANACIDLIREHCTIVVPGNHDLFAVGRIPAYKAGIEYPDNWFNMELGVRMHFMKGKIWFYENEVTPELTETNKQYLNALPEHQILTTDDGNILLTHFLYPDVSGSLTKRIDDIYDYRNHFLFMRKNSCKLSFAGHMHKEGFEVVNIRGVSEFGFTKKRLRMTESFIGLPPVAGGTNKNGVTVFDTRSFEIKAIRIK